MTMTLFSFFFSTDDENDESKMSFFHGKLRIHVISAEDLPDTDTAFFNIDGKDVTDPYVTGDLGYARIFKVLTSKYHFSRYSSSATMIIHCKVGKNQGHSLGKTHARFCFYAVSQELITAPFTIVSKN
jgi:hypothetical protein